MQIPNKCTYCKDCLEKKAAIRRLDTLDKYYQKTYKITLEDYMHMLDEQKHQCAICKQYPDDERLCVDHDHNTGIVRKLLCMECNLLIGIVEIKGLSVITSVLTYIEKHNLD